MYCKSSEKRARARTKALYKTAYMGLKDIKGFEMC